MMGDTPYLPNAVFAPVDEPGATPPRVLISPARYVQGDGVLDDLGRYLAVVPSRAAGVIASAGGWRRDGERLRTSLRAAGIDCYEATFEGECSVDEVNRLAETFRNRGVKIDAIIAVGGGKCVDAGKAIAYRLRVPAIVCPTLASNDAPCSALSVMYESSGAFTGVEFFEQSPAMVVVDTGIVARAPARYLVAGMGDAMATWYEARTCFENPVGRSCLGTRPPIAAVALARLCADTLYEDGQAALEAVPGGAVSESLERVVEANTLLSGLGFESGGIALAHCVAQGLTLVPSVHERYLHGEMVAIGLLTQLHVEGRPDEAAKVATFFANIGLPVSLGQLSLSEGHEDELRTVADVAMSLPFVGNEPVPVTADSMVAALREVNTRGSRLIANRGAEAYSALH